MAKTFTITRSQTNAFSSSGFANLGFSVYTINTNLGPVGSSPGSLVWFFQHNDSFQISGPPLQNLTFDSLPPGIIFTQNKMGWNIPTTFLNFDGPPANDDITDPAGHVLHATNLTVTFGLSNINLTVLQFFGFWNIAAQVSVNAQLIVTLAHTITGEYTTTPVSISAPNPTVTGDQVTLTGTQLDSIGSIQLMNAANDIITIPATDFLVQTPFILIFRIPIDSRIIGLINVIGIGNGTQFSGFVTLGTLTVLFENASGIYKIVPNKRTDTLYNRLGYSVIPPILPFMLDDLWALDRQFIDEKYLINVDLNKDGQPETIIMINELGLLELEYEELEPDTILLNRQDLPGISTREVKIPDPFWKLGFIGG